MSCWANCCWDRKDALLRIGILGLGGALFKLFDFALSNKEPGLYQPGICIDFLGIVDIIYWMFENSTLDSFVLYDIASLPLMLWPIAHSRALEASGEFRKLGICPSRVWNIANISPRTTMDVPAMLAMVRVDEYPVATDKHHACTEQIYLLSDDNSTLARQTHKCGLQECSKEKIFPPQILNSAFSSSGQRAPTAWAVSRSQHDPSSVTGSPNPSLIGPSQAYIAISHVWADGTGVGLKTPGSVNRCLYDYFARIAERLGCKGLWWDTICVPSGREERKLAISNMLQNYERARYTVVHDQDLINCEWRDDGSPVMALILSSWFTRAWTAAELFASRSHEVKILFKDPHSSSRIPLIKDLDIDILQWKNPLDDRRHEFGKLGYHIAVNVVQSFRRGHSQIGNFQQLMKVLRPRTTSWARDRMIIAGLLCLPSDGNYEPYFLVQTLRPKKWAHVVECRYVGCVYLSGSTMSGSDLSPDPDIDSPQSLTGSNGTEYDGETGLEGDSGLNGPPTVFCRLGNDVDESGELLQEMNAGLAVEAWNALNIRRQMSSDEVAWFGLHSQPVDIQQISFHQVQERTIQHQGSDHYSLSQTAVISFNLESFENMIALEFLKAAGFASQWVNEVIPKDEADGRGYIHLSWNFANLPQTCSSRFYISETGKYKRMNKMETRFELMVGWQTVEAYNLGDPMLVWEDVMYSRNNAIML
ncbi:MAG: hypothetical protein Q9164_001989 [Protoblastenia rupestris]